MTIQIQNFADLYWKLLSLGNFNKDALHAREDILFECVIGMGTYQIKRLFGYQDDPNYSSYHADTRRESENALRAIRSDLNRCSIPFREEKSEFYKDDGDKKRTFVTETKITFSISPEKRAEIVQTQLAYDTQKYLSECRSKAGIWYERFSRLDIIDTIKQELEAKIDEGLTQCLELTRGLDGAYEYRTVPLGWGTTGITIDLVGLRTVFPFSASITYKDLGYQDLDDQQQVNALQALVMEKLIAGYRADPHRYACGIYYKREPSMIRPVLMIVPKLIYAPDTRLRSWS